MAKESKSSSKEEGNYLLDELKQTNEKLNKLVIENSKLLKIIRENDLEEEITEMNSLSMEESICLNGLAQLAHIFESGIFSKDNVQEFDILYKNYRMIQGLDSGEKKKGKEKPMKVGELIRIAKGIGEK